MSHPLEILGKKPRLFLAEKVPQHSDLHQFSKKLEATEFKFLDVEIGCGVGFHPIRYSKENPDRLLVAIEHSKERFGKFSRRFEAHGCPKNLYPVHANAISWITHELPPNSVDRIFILYPNPYLKKVQINRRWYRASFMGKLLEILKMSGEIHLSTNIEDYAQEARSYFSQIWELTEISFEMFNSKESKDFVAQTHFEKKYFDRGESIFRMSFVRSS